MADPIDMFGAGGGSSGGDKKVFTPRRGGPLSRLALPQNKWVKLALAALVILAFAYGSFLVYVEPNQYGIKAIKIGAHRGIQRDIYGAGLHFVLPFGIQQMYVLPKDIQVLELTNYKETASQFAWIEKAAHIQTSDGFFVDVDVSIVYHIADPYMVFTTIGPGNLYIHNGIIPKTEPVLKETLGELTTEEFYNSNLRVEKASRAKMRLNQELSDKGLLVDQLLIRYFRYSDEIQKNIEEKKLKDQLVFKNQAEARAATESANLKKVTQEGEMLYKIKLSEGEAYVTRRQAEKDLYVRKTHARADLLIKLAEAKKTELRNTALQGQGSDRMVGLRMAETLNGLETIILPSDGQAGVNPLDLRKTLDLFNVRHDAGTRQGQTGGAQ